MKKILILGANGQIAKVATELFLTNTDASLTLYLRKAKRLEHLKSNERVSIVEGDVLDKGALKVAMQNQDVVYANLDGDLPRLAECITETMKEVGIKRLIFVSSMGIYGEVPGQRYQSILDPYRDGAAIVEGSGLTYTILRPAWLDNRDEINYGTTQKGQAFENANSTVSRKSVADLIVKLACTANDEIGSSLGVHKRN